jgi:membrane associated rhomboid family serine protease
MFKSIADDIRNNFTYGHMVTRLIIINTAVLVVILLLKAFFSNLGWYQPVIQNVAMPTNAIELLLKPWTLFTYMFVHEGFWHFVWNMVGLNIFGKIVGDLIGDKKVLPLYLLGGIAGGILLILVTPLMSNLNYASLRGASAAVLALAMAGALIAPDYNIRLLLIGNVKLKYIVLFFIIADLVLSQGYENAGGHWAHLGGILMGAIFIAQLRNGRDMGKPINSLFKKISDIGSKKYSGSKHRPIMKVEHRSNKLTNKTRVIQQDDYEAKLDAILEKIKRKGYDKLSQDERDFLNKASKK